jgi:hypothetical protein
MPWHLHTSLCSSWSCVGIAILDCCRWWVAVCVGTQASLSLSWVRLHQWGSSCMGSAVPDDNRQLPITGWNHGGYELQGAVHDVDRGKVVLLQVTQRQMRRLMRRRLTTRMPPSPALTSFRCLHCRHACGQHPQKAQTLFYMSRLYPDMNVAFGALVAGCSCISPCGLLKLEQCGAHSATWGGGRKAASCTKLDLAEAEHMLQTDRR